MPKFAYCGVTVGTDSQRWLRQFDSESSLLPFAFHRTDGAVGSIAVSGVDNNQFIVLRGKPPCYEICRTTGPNTETLLYTHPTFIWSVRVRTVASEDRIYFSAPDVSTSKKPYPVNIYYLKSVPVPFGAPPHPSPPPMVLKAFLYTTIESEQLLLPNPCPPFTGEFWATYGGDFVFGDNDTLYLSSGNNAGPNLQVGIFKITGAGPDSVSGAIERIHLGEGPIQQLCFRSPQSLYFMRYSEIWEFDLVTKVETSVGTIPEVTIMRDLAEIGDGVPVPYITGWIEGPVVVLYKAFTKATKLLWRLADALSRQPRS